MGGYDLCNLKGTRKFLSFYTIQATGQFFIVPVCPIYHFMKMIKTILKRKKQYE